MSIRQFYTKHRVWQVLLDDPFNFYGFFLPHERRGRLSRALRRFTSLGYVSRSILWQSQDFRHSVSDRQSVLEMGRKAPVQRPHGPVVRVALGPPVADVDHRLDGDHHPLPEKGAGTGGAVVGHLRVLVHLAT